MKKLIYLILLIFSISSCSMKDNGFDTPEEISDKRPVEIKIGVNEKKGNIFDLMEFNLYSKKGITLLDIAESYDSIVWACSNTNQHFKVFEHSVNSSHFLFNWSNCFFLPADYETCLLGYKNNRIIYSDTISVSISNNKDFLGYNWKDVVRSSECSTGYQNVFLKGYNFATYSVVTEGVPSLYLLLLRANNEDEVVFAQKSKQVLFDYINSLYSVPTYSRNENNSISDIYNQLFRNKRADAIPEYIWITPKSRIVLIKKYDELVNYPKYEIYAESVW
ncbi:MAG: hypothetical protein Q8880_13115 [Bacteroidota bacterium]|nr:hypothetical protein [Bacteroidota bacterium]